MSISQYKYKGEFILILFQVDIRKNFAFVQFSTVEEATEARIAINGKLVCYC